MARTKERMAIGKIIIIAVIVFAVFAVLGVALASWFSTTAKPAVRTIRDAVEWSHKFTLYYYIGTGFTLVYTFIMAMLAAVLDWNKKTNWIVNTLVTIIVAAIIAAVFVALNPTKTSECRIVAAIVIFVQGPMIYILSSLGRPGTWERFLPWD